MKNKKNNKKKQKKIVQLFNDHYINIALQIPDFRYEIKNTQNEHIIAHFEYFFTCHNKNVWLAENLNEIKITHYEKIFSRMKQNFSHFEKGLGNLLTKKTFFLSH